MSAYAPRGPTATHRAGPAHPLRRASWRGLTCLLLLFQPLAARAQSLDDGVAAMEEALLAERYRQVIALSESGAVTEAAEVPFYRGVAHHALGNPAAAEAALREYLRVGGVFTEEAQRLLALIREAADIPVSLRRLKTLVQAGVVYDSRVIILQDDPPYLREEDGLAARLRLAMDLNPAPGTRLRYRGHWLQYLDWSEASRLDQSLSVGFWHPALGGDLEWTALGESGLLDGEPVFWRVGGRAEQAWVVAEDRIAWAALEAGQDRFPESEGFDGVYGHASLGYEQYSRNATLLWDLFGQWHDAKEDPLRFYEFGAGLASSYAFSDRWAAGLSARLSRILYDEYDPIYGVKRDDLHLSGRAWISLTLSESISLVPSLEAVTNDSNDGLADYDEHVIAVDVVWSRW